MRRAAQPAFCKPVCTPGPWCCASLLNSGDKLILETPNKLSLLLLLFHYVSVDWEGLAKQLGWRCRGSVYCLKERWEVLAPVTVTHFSPPLWDPLWPFYLFRKLRTNEETYQFGSNFIQGNLCIGLMAGCLYGRRSDPFQDRDLGKRKKGVFLGARVSKPLLENQLEKLGQMAPLSSFPFPETMGLRAVSGPWNL